MEVFVRECRPADKLQLIGLIEILQDFVVNIDPIRRLRRLPAFGEAYTEALFKRMEYYFRLKGCDSVRVEVFVPNTDAREFYAGE